MKATSLFLIFLSSTILAFAQVETPPDSILKKVEGMKNISAIKYLEKKYPNGNVKSKGWAYLFQDGNKTKFVRLGHWEYFRKDGTKEFEDFMPINDAKPITELHYDKEGKMWKRVLHAQEFDNKRNLKGQTYVEETFYDDGTLKSRRQYRDNKKAGTWKTFNQDGSISNQQEYGSVE